MVLFPPSGGAFSYLVIVWPKYFYSPLWLFLCLIKDSLSVVLHLFLEGILLFSSRHPLVLTMGGNRQDIHFLVQKINLKREEQQCEM